MKFFEKWKTKSFESWKKKAKERRLENKELKKRVSELSESRDIWREKYEATFEQLKKKRLMQILSGR